MGLSSGFEVKDSYRAWKSSQERRLIQTSEDLPLEMWNIDNSAAGDDLKWLPGREQSVIRVNQQSPREHQALGHICTNITAGGLQDHRQRKDKRGIHAAQPSPIRHAGA